MALATDVMVKQRRTNSLQFKDWINKADKSVFDVDGGIIPQTDSCDLFMAKSKKIAFIIEEQSSSINLTREEKTRAAQLIASNIVSIVKKDMKVHSSGSFFTNVVFPGVFPYHLEVSLYALQDVYTGEMRHEIPVTMDRTKTRGNPIFVTRIVPHSG